MQTQSNQPFVTDNFTPLTHTVEMM